MPVSLWNSVLKKVVPLTPKVKGVLTWYACGPTAYESAHIGHASSYIRQDVIRRLLELDGSTLLQVMGVTDIDDKIIRRAAQSGIPWDAVSRKYEVEFFGDLEKLNVKHPHVRSRVTDFVPQIVEFVGKLLEGGVAYRAQDGSVYFDTGRYGKYGKLRKISLSSAEGGDVAEEKGEGKRSPSDFAVWKGHKEGEPFWPAPWGKGRPGWHIECSVMASHFFGTSLDIHSGGVDLIFPHHENEEAQCCARFGTDQWVTHWIHTGHLNMKGDVKMSKSLGNTITISDFLKDSRAEELRMLCILSKYRHGLEFSPASLHHAKSVLKKMESFLSDTQAILYSLKSVELNSGSELWQSFIKARETVQKALLSDFDTPTAIQEISTYIDTFNKAHVPAPATKGTAIDLGLVMSSREFVNNFLSLTGFYNEKTESSENFMADYLLEEVNKFRGTVRDFALAVDEDDRSIRKTKIAERKPLLDACDKIRENLKNIGVDVKDYQKATAPIKSKSKSS